MIRVQGVIAGNVRQGSLGVVVRVELVDAAAFTEGVEARSGTFHLQRGVVKGAFPGIRAPDPENDRRCVFDCLDGREDGARPLRESIRYALHAQAVCTRVVL